MSGKVRLVRRISYIIGLATILINLIGRSIYDARNYKFNIITSVIVIIMFAVAELINVFKDDESKRINILIITLYLFDILFNIGYYIGNLLI